MAAKNKTNLNVEDCAYCKSLADGKCSKCGNRVCQRHGWQGKDRTTCFLCILSRNNDYLGEIFHFIGSCQSPFLVRLLSAAISLGESEETGILGSGEVLYASLNITDHPAYKIFTSNPKAHAQLTHKYDLLRAGPLFGATRVVLEAFQLAEKSLQPSLVLFDRLLRNDAGELGSHCWQLMQTHGYDMDKVGKTLDSHQKSRGDKDGSLLVVPIEDRLRVFPLNFFSAIPVGDDEGSKDAFDFMSSYPVINSIPSQSAIEELENLINESTAAEADFQDLFERNPELLAGREYIHAVPHLALSDALGRGIPDFFLCRTDTGLCDILDLKLPKHKVVTGPERRRQFSKELKDAIAQLREYRDYFDDKAHRQMFRDTYKLEAYKPNVSVVIGRSSSFRSTYERQKIQLDTYVKIITYDDILRMASRRLALKKGVSKSGE